MKNMKTKKGVTLDNLDLKLLAELPILEKLIKAIEGSKYEMTITSANDGIHMKNSLHYENKAVDLRTRDMYKKFTNYNVIKAYLGTSYDVILESDHIHIEYQPKKKKGGK